MILFRDGSNARDADERESGEQDGGDFVHVLAQRLARGAVDESK
jgi:hypothetical protein